MQRRFKSNRGENEADDGIFLEPVFFVRQEDGNLTTYGRQNIALQYAAADLADEVGWGWREKCGLTAARSRTAAWNDSPSSLERSLRPAVPTSDSVGVPPPISLCLSLLCLPLCLPDESLAVAPRPLQVVQLSLQYAFAAVTPTGLKKNFRALFPANHGE